MFCNDSISQVPLRIRLHLFLFIYLFIFCLLRSFHKNKFKICVYVVRKTRQIFQLKFKLIFVSTVI